MPAPKSSRQSSSSERHTYSGELWDVIQENHPFPLTVMMTLTERCNLSCKHCYIPPNASGSEDLTTAEIADLLDQLADVGTLRLILTGGEPTLRSDLVDLVKQAMDRRFLITLKTNGTLLDRTIVEQLWNAGLSELHVSLYTTEPESHDEFVGKTGAFEHSTEALNYFRKLGGISRANLVIMPWNAGSISKLVDLCESNEWVFCVEHYVHHRIDRESAPRELRAQGETLVQAISDTRLDNRLLSEKKHFKTNEDPLCLAGNGICVVMPNGEIWPCQLLPKPFGNIRDQSFREIWLNSKERHLLTKSLFWDIHPPCLECDLSWACQRCPGDAYLEHGNIGIPTEYDCQMAKVAERVWHNRRGSDPEGKSEKKNSI
ncbi:MAG: radical SAM protein [Deltaproteobacteria bacterium]|nr:radical SAM protein [Deltaproteobacteria bacterium]